MFLILLALSFPVMALFALALVIGARSRITALEGRVTRVEQKNAALREALDKAVSGRSAIAPDADLRPATGTPSSASQAPPPATQTDAVRATPEDAAQAEAPETPAIAARDLASPDAVQQPPQDFTDADARTNTGALPGNDVPGSDLHTADAQKPLPQKPSPKTSTAAPSRSLEERLGARWSVWVGAVALAIGGLMLVRFSIEEGYFGPAARVVMGLALGLGLCGAGEWLRRRDLRAGRAAASTDDPFAVPGVPAALTAAGSAAIFGAVYAAYALYGFIGPAAAFVALGVVAVLAMFSAALQGPALAALGLPASLAAPLLVSSNQPNLWALTLYFAAVVGSAYALARIRRWRWLAIAAAGGAWLWGVALLAAGYDAPLAVSAHVIIQLVLAAAVLTFEPHWRTPDNEARPDGFALLVLAAFTTLGIGVYDLPLSVPALVLSAGVMAAILFAAGWRLAPVAAATVLAGAMTMGALWNWRVVALAAQEPQTLAPGGVGAHPMPESLVTYLAFAIIAGFVISAGALRRLLAGRHLPLFAAASYAAAATLTPLGVMTVVWMKVANFDASIPFAIVAALLALAGAVITGRLRASPEAEAPNQRLATGAIASAAVAAIALGLTFALDKGMLTVAFALAAAGTAWVAARLQLPALRYAVGAIGLLILGRLAWNPSIAADGAIGATPVFNWLLWGYGAPAVAFWAAAALLAREKRDRITALCESLAIIFSTLLVLFEIRHFLNGGDPFRAASDHLEAGLLASSSLLFSLALSRMNTRRADPVYRIASMAFMLISTVLIVMGLLLIANPYFLGGRVLGGALFNSLIPAYLIPAIIAAGLAALNRRIWPRWRTLVTAVLALALFTAWVMLAIRRYFQGPSIGVWRSTGEAEWWCYTAALLVIGVALLAWGLARKERLVRLASAAFILAAVLKAFLFDMSSLDGIWRALSFIGLGLVLIGIARAYQLLLYPPSQPGTENAPQPAPDGPGGPNDADVTTTSKATDGDAKRDVSA